MPEPSEDPIEDARADGRTRLTEAESKSLLANAGVAVPTTRVVTGPDAALDAAEGLGYPVVCKVSSPSVAHKSEWGDGAGVALGLDSPRDVHEAAERIGAAAAKAGIEDAEVLVEESRDTDAGTEVILGGLRDDSFGPVVVVGLGGVFTEIFEDTSHRLAPVDREQAHAAIEELTAARLLDGYRGRPSADRDALAEAVVAVGDLVCERDAIAEIDVNPVLATDAGAVALDAFVRLEAP